jgi:predicted GTPase
VNETVALLAARAPKLRKAVREAKKAGCAYVVLDGTLIPVDRSRLTARSTPASTGSTG